jgi:hypothetical protein
MELIVARKPSNMDDFYNWVEYTPTKAMIIEVIHLDNNTYEELTNDFYKSYQFLSGKGGCSNGVDLFIEIINRENKEKPKLYVNPHGFDYARYVGIKYEGSKK